MLYEIEGVRQCLRSLSDICKRRAENTDQGVLMALAQGGKRLEGGANENCQGPDPHWLIVVAAAASHRSCRPAGFAIALGAHQIALSLQVQCNLRTRGVLVASCLRTANTGSPR